jgi:hypothetical protein
MAREAQGAPDLDRWLTDPAVRTAHRRDSRAPAQVLWQAAATVALGDSRLLGRLVVARIAGTDPGVTFASMFRSPPFLLLEDGPTFALTGLCGRIWTMRGEFAPLAAPDDFLDWREPGTARVLFAHWVVPRAGGSTIHSEVRVAPVDRRAALYMRALEPFITAFQGLVGREALAPAVRRAERRTRSVEPSSDRRGDR